MIVIVLVGLITSIKKFRRENYVSILLLAFCGILTIISKRAFLYYIILLLPLFTFYICQTFEKYKNLFNKYVLVIVVLILFIPSLRTIYSNVRNRNTDNAEDYYKIAKENKRISDENGRIYSHRLFGVMYLASDRLSSKRYFFIPGFEDDAPIFDDFKVHFEMNYPKYIVINDKRFYNGKTDEYINDLLLKQYELINSSNHVKLYKIK